MAARPRRYALRLPTTTHEEWKASGTAAIRSVFGDDELGKMATTLFQSSTTSQTDQNYFSSLKSFFEFRAGSILDPQQVTPIDLARYIAWLGTRGTIAVASLQSYLSSINKYLQDHALPPVALGTLVSGVRKGLKTAKRTCVLSLNGCRCRHPWP